MEHGIVSSSLPDLESFFTHDGKLSVRIIIIWFKKFWGLGMVVKRNNIVYRGNIPGIWNHIRGIPSSFVWYGTIINGNGRKIQIWDTTINLEGFIEAVIN